MFADIDQGQSNQTIGRIAAAMVELVGVIHAVAAFGTGALVIQVFEALRRAGDRGKEARVAVGFDGHTEAEVGVGVTVRVPRAVGSTELMVKASALARGMVRRTGVAQAVFSLIEALEAHPPAAGTEGCAILVKAQIGLRLRGMWKGGRGIGFGQGNHRQNALLLQIAVDRGGVMVAVADKHADFKRQMQVADQFQQVIQGFQGEREIGLIAADEQGQQGQVMAFQISN